MEVVMYLPHLLFDPKAGGNTFLQNTSELLLECTREDTIFTQDSVVLSVALLEGQWVVTPSLYIPN
jgi:hypothetical protein